ncbi:MAG: DUF5665 domain-containing protein [Patescibacteria group bacterium]
MANDKIPENSMDKIDLNNKLLSKSLKLNKWYYVFGRGIIAGLGASIGAAIVISGLAYVLNRVDFAPFMGGFIEKTKTILENAR